MMRPQLGPLRVVNFRRLFVGYATSLLGTGMAPVGIAFAVLDGGGTAADLGFVLTAGTASMIVFLLLGGLIADRMGRRAVMLGSDVLRCASQATVAGLVIAGHPPLWALMLLSGVTGAGSGVFNPCLMALTNDVERASQTARPRTETRERGLPPA